jgi:predicted RNA-binding Zn ribbon-like protein
MRAGGGITLRDLAGVSYRFDPGRLCLEFAHTGGEGFRAAYETLHASADLAGWIRSSLDVDVEGEPDLAAAKRLREAIWRLADDLVDDRIWSDEAIDVVNRAAARPPLVPTIDREGRHRWAGPVRTGSVLSTIARDAIDLFTGADADRTRRCEGTDCYLIFVDASRAGRRRWCSMQRCGNRVKVREFRGRQRKEEAR